MLAIVLAVVLPVVRRLRHVQLMPVSDIRDNALRKKLRAKLEQVAQASNDVRWAPDNMQLTATTYARSWTLAMCLASSIAVLLLLMALAFWLRCLQRAQQCPREWTQRRKHTVLEAGLKAVLLIMSSVVDAMFAIRRLVRPQSACEFSAFEQVASCFGGSLWVALTVLMCVHQHGRMFCSNQCGTHQASRASKVAEGAWHVITRPPLLVHQRKRVGMVLCSAVLKMTSLSGLADALSVLILLDACGPTPVKGRRGVVAKDLPYRRQWFKFVILLVGVGATRVRWSSFKFAVAMSLQSWRQAPMRKVLSCTSRAVRSWCRPIAMHDSACKLFDTCKHRISSC